MINCADTVARVTGKVIQCANTHTVDGTIVLLALDFESLVQDNEKHGCRAVNCTGRICPNLLRIFA